MDPARTPIRIRRHWDAAAERTAWLHPAASVAALVDWQPERWPDDGGMPEEIALVLGGVLAGMGRVLGRGTGAAADDAAGVAALIDAGWACQGQMLLVVAPGGETEAAAALRRRRDWRDFHLADPVRLLAAPSNDGDGVLIAAAARAGLDQVLDLLADALRHRGFPLAAAAGAPWTPALVALHRRIEAHGFDGGAALGFTGRLARDHGWTAAFAAGAVREYGRFCFLAIASPTPVTPSEQVDEVWRLHLACSRDYWDAWCGGVLGAALHHDPTKEAPEEQQRLGEQYASTLASYEAFFGPPPEAFWPATDKRFAARPRFRIVDTRRWLLLPRTPWRWARPG